MTGVQERLAGVMLALIERDAALHVRNGLGGLAHGDQRGPQGMVGLDELAGVVTGLRHRQQLFPGREGGGIVAARVEHEP